jgi:hypothetical protein
VGPLGVVVTTPLFDDDLGFFQGVEDLAVEQFVPEASVEAQEPRSERFSDANPGKQ